MAREWAWQALLAEQTFLSVAAMAQTNAIPSDWDGRMISDSFWNRTQRRPVIGPLTSQEWQEAQATGVNIVTDCFRFRADGIDISPTPSAGQTYAFEYVSSYWCETSAGVGQAAWAADTDVPRLDAELMTLGVVWRFLSGRGMDNMAVKADYENEVFKAKARDGSRRVVSLSSGSRANGYARSRFPEGSWNV